MMNKSLVDRHPVKKQHKGGPAPYTNSSGKEHPSFLGLLYLGKAVCAYFVCLVLKRASAPLVQTLGSSSIKSSALCDMTSYNC